VPYSKNFTLEQVGKNEESSVDPKYSAVYAEPRVSGVQKYCVTFAGAAGISYEKVREWAGSN